MDCANVRSLSEFKEKRKDFVALYSSVQDERFEWFRSIFLKYLNDWKDSTLSPEGNVTKDNRNMMFLFMQTYEGFTITANCLIEVTKFLLSEGFEYALTERFCSGSH